MASQVSSSDGNRVRWPNSLAITWSMEMPARMSVALFFRRTPVRKVPLPRAWSPPPSGPRFGRLVVEAAEDLDVALCVSSGASVRLDLKSAPSPVGHHAAGIAPLGK